MVNFPDGGKVVTVTEFAEAHGCDYQTAVGFIRYLKEKGLVAKAGKRHTGGRGKPNDLYMVPTKIELTLIFDDLGG